MGNTTLCSKNATLCGIISHFVVKIIFCDMEIKRSISDDCFTDAV